MSIDNKANMFKNFPLESPQQQSSRLDGSSEPSYEAVEFTSKNEV
jgi:hypothetical protein